MAKSLFKNQYIITVYELAKTGMSEVAMAKVLGISTPTFYSWEAKKPAFKLAIQEGRKVHKGEGKIGASFRDYVFQRLSPELRVLWKKINKLNKSKSGTEKIEALLANRGKSIRQHLFIYAWTASNFSLSQALKKVNISRSTFDLWKNTEPDFLKLVQEIDWHKKNFFEDSLCRLIAGGDTSATIFANRTRNRDRGYNEKIEVDMEVDGSINQHIVSMNLLKLPLNTRKEILKSIREKNDNSANKE